MPEGATAAVRRVVPQLGVLLRLELNYRSRQPILDAAAAALRPAYVGREAEQLKLVTPRSLASPDQPRSIADTGTSAMDGADPSRDAVGSAAGDSEPSVEIVRVADGDSEATYTVERILREMAKDDGGVAERSVLANGQSQESFGILYRTNAQALVFEKELLKQGVSA